VGAPLAVALIEDDWAAHVARSAIEIRPATPDDRAFAFATLRDAMRAYVAAAFGAWDDAQQRALFAPTFDLGTHRVLRDGGADVGILAVETHVDRVHLARLFIAPTAQGRGLGGRVVAALVAWSHAHGLPVALTVLRSNPDARRFYERHGFRVVADTPTHLHLENDPAAPPPRS
jgi:GNAT superfamily N-acetyltransferase